MSPKTLTYISMSPGERRLFCACKVSKEAVVVTHSAGFGGSPFRMGSPNPSGPLARPPTRGRHFTTEGRHQKFAQTHPQHHPIHTHPVSPLVTMARGLGTILGGSSDTHSWSCCHVHPSLGTLSGQGHLFPCAEFPSLT